MYFKREINTVMLLHACKIIIAKNGLDTMMLLRGCIHVLSKEKLSFPFFVSKDKIMMAQTYAN